MNQETKSYIESIYREKVEYVIKWSEQHPEFDPGFMRTMLQKLDQYGVLTDNQMNAVDNIITAWKIELPFEELFY